MARNHSNKLLFNGAEPFEQIVNTLATEGFMWNLVKIAQAVSKKKTFKDYTILNMYIAQRQGQITPGDRILIVTKIFYYFNHTFYKFQPLVFITF